MNDIILSYEEFTQIFHPKGGISDSYKWYYNHYKNNTQLFMNTVFVAELRKEYDNIINNKKLALIKQASEL